MKWYLMAKEFLNNKWTIYDGLVNFKGQMILSRLLVVAWIVQWRLFGDKVRPVHLPPKKEEGTALPPGEPDRPFSGRFPGVAEF